MKDVAVNPAVRIDLLSDTLTRPTSAMRQAMAQAEVGDDVFGEDPTTARLEHHIATLLGKEAALFMPSGTMSNAIGLLIHCNRGEEFLCEAGCHIYNNEQAGYAQLRGTAVQPITAAGGELTLDHLRDAIRKEDVHLACTRLVCLEQTHNRAGGKVLPYEGIAEIAEQAWPQRSTAVAMAPSFFGLAKHLLLDIAWRNGLMKRGKSTLGTLSIRWGLACDFADKPSP